MCIRVGIMDSDRSYINEFALAYKKNIAPYEQIEYISSFEELREASEEHRYDVYFIAAQYERVLEELPQNRVLVLEDEEFELSDRDKKYRTVTRNMKYLDVMPVILSMYEEFLYTKIRERIISQDSVVALSDEELRDKVDRVYGEVESCENLPRKTKRNMIDRIFYSFRGLGVIDTLLKDDEITEIMINDYDCIFIEKGGRLEKTNITFDSREQLLDIIQRIVGKAGREVNQSSPIVDTRLEDGSRVHIVLSPITLNGPTVTIRRFSKEPMTMDRLVEYGSISDLIAQKLRLLVEAKYNIFISGGTGSGKTTFLNALSDYIPKSERIITIEDSAELQIKGVDNLVRMETRNANISGAGEITMRDLIKASLRMRPERIIVGEVRGEEALDMLQAMNTGHDGSISTGHANSTPDMLARLETMVLMAATGLPSDAIKRQIGSSIDIIIHLSRMRDHSRKTMEISEVVGYENGQIVLNPLYVFEEDAEKSTINHVVGGLVRTKNRLQNRTKLLQAGIYEEI